MTTKDEIDLLLKIKDANRPVPKLETYHKCVECGKVAAWQTVNIKNVDEYVCTPCFWAIHAGPPQGDWRVPR